MAMGLAKGSAGQLRPTKPQRNAKKGPKVTSDLLKTTAERADCYLQSLKGRSVSPSAEMLARLTNLGGSLPDEPTDLAEASRRARGVEVWAALRSLGRCGVGDLVSRNCRFAERLQQAGCDILNDVVSNQVLIAFGGAEITHQVISAIQADGTCWCGQTIWQGRVAMRISVCSWATTEDDVEQSLTAMVRIAAGIRDGRSG